MSCRIVNESEIRTAPLGKVDQKFIWTLWYLGRNEPVFCGSFPTAGEADQHALEGLADSRRPYWRYLVHGVEVGQFVKAGL